MTTPMEHAWIYKRPYRFIGYGNQIPNLAWTGLVAVILDRPPAYGALDMDFEEMRWLDGGVNVSIYKLVPHESGWYQEYVYDEVWNSLTHTDAYGEINIYGNNFEVLSEDGTLMHPADYGHDFEQYSKPPTVSGTKTTSTESVNIMMPLFPSDEWDFSGGGYPTLIQDPFEPLIGNRYGIPITLAEAKMQNAYLMLGWSFEEGYWNIWEGVSFPYLDLKMPVYIDVARQGLAVTDAQSKSKATYLGAGWDFTYWTLIEGETRPYHPYSPYFIVAIPDGLCHIKYNHEVITPIKVFINNAIGYVQLVDVGTVHASPIKVQVPDGIKALEMVEDRSQIPFSY